MESWFRNVPPDNRRCFARVGLLQEMLEVEQAALDQLLIESGVPGKATAALKRLPPGDKRDAIKRQVEHHRSSPTSLWFGQDHLEIIAALLWRSDLKASLREVLWPDVKKESDLVQHVAPGFENEKYDVYAEIPMGRNRIDLLCHRKGGLFTAERFAGVELKKSLDELKRGLDQMTVFGDYTHQMYLACTPALGARCLDRHARGRGVKHWDPNALASQLERARVGLILVDHVGVQIAIEAPVTTVRSEKTAELREHLIPRNHWSAVRR